MAPPNKLQRKIRATVCYLREALIPTMVSFVLPKNLVNAYKTDSNGLPLEDGIDVSKNDYVDTRLDHTVARPGIMFLDVQLYDWTPREATVYGPYSPKKRIVSKNSSYYLAIWPYVNALNV